MIPAQTFLFFDVTPVRAKGKLERLILIENAFSVVTVA
jgi:hypothetical protein